MPKNKKHNFSIRRINKDVSPVVGARHASPLLRYAGMGAGIGAFVMLLMMAFEEES